MSQPTNDTTETGWSTAHLTTSERHRLLRSERRREVLDVLAGQATTVELTELASQVAAGEDDVHRVSVSLHHSHLPLMEDVGVLEYDAESNVVDPDGGGTDLAPTDLIEQL